MTPQHEIIDYALAYAERGWHIFPVWWANADGTCGCGSPTCKDIGKHPIGGCAPRGVWDASSDLKRVLAWWRGHPNANIGLHCGPSGVVAADLDTYKDVYNATVTGEIITSADERTVTNLTGGGGAQLLFKGPEGQRFGSKNRGLPPGIDIRAWGGYIILPPSLHRSGRRYQWENGFAPDEIEILPLPARLEEILAAAQSAAAATRIAITPNLPKPDLTPWHLPGWLSDDLHNGHLATDRSTNDWRVICALVERGLSDDDLVAIWQHYPIGAQGKFAEHKTPTEYLSTMISKIRAEKGHPTGAHNGFQNGVRVAGALASTPANDVQPQFDLFDYRPEDGGILDCWLDLYGADWLYVTGYECWYTWTGTHWAKDECQHIHAQIQELMHAMNQSALNQLQDAYAELEAAGGSDDFIEARIEKLKSYVAATKRSAARVSSVTTMAQAQRATAANRLDAGNVLNLANGTLDLDTLTLRPHSGDDRLTYCLGYGYNPDALAPRFEQFVSEVLVHEYQNDGGQWITDTELCLLFQELLGYSLTNDTRHEVMTWLSGDGGNGKTVAITIIQKLLGTLCCSVDFQTIGLPGDYSIADIPGKRVIFSTESERGGKLAEGYIKRIVSGERINARAIYGRPFEFNSVSKIWWAMNDKPIIRDTGNSVWRRLKLIPFHRTFTEQERDPDLLAKLESELPGILNFALDGLRRLRQRGRLPESAAVNQAISDYRQESNPVAQWIGDCTNREANPVTLQSALYQNYREWCSRSGRQELNSTNFAKELKRLRIGTKRGNAGQMYALRIL